MAFEGLSDRLENAFKKLRAKGKLTEADVKEAMREVRMALLEADVNYKVAKEFTNKVAERAIGAQVMESLTPGEMVIKIVNEALTALKGGTQSRLASASHGPTVIMMCGLQGSGKTTHSAKLAKMLKEQGHRPLLVACDIYRPAAIQQLQVVGEQAGVHVFEMGTENPVSIARQAVRYAKDYGNDYVFLDTAGRLHIDEELMAELSSIKSEIQPHEILLVIDAMTGQDAVNVAKKFDETLGIDGVVLTKLDGDTRGGAALSVRAVTGKPIKFAGTGEKLADLEPFHPDRMASRILGMGDVLSLIEKAEDQLDEKKAQEMERRLRQNKFDLNDLLSQMQELQKMGSLKDTLGMIPGLGNKLKDVDVDESIFTKMEAIIYSMTPQERQKPDIINHSRKKRIAAGCGKKVEDVNQLLAQHREMQKMYKQFSGKNNKNARMSKKMRRMMNQNPEMMKNMGNMGGMGGGFPF
ncbi:MAG: signal recognition particle protein [Clostridiales bacterium]|nr:signal recognition particle protein [Clostridiales bacterium]